MFFEENTLCTDHRLTCEWTNHSYDLLDFSGGSLARLRVIVDGAMRGRDIPCAS